MDEIQIRFTQLAQASACALKKLRGDKKKTVKLQKENKWIKVEYMQKNYKGTSGRLRQIGEIKSIMNKIRQKDDNS